MMSTYVSSKRSMARRVGDHPSAGPSMENRSKVVETKRTRAEQVFPYKFEPVARQTPCNSVSSTSLRLGDHFVKLQMATKKACLVCQKVPETGVKQCGRCRVRSKCLRSLRLLNKLHPSILGRKLLWNGASEASRWPVIGSSIIIVHY